MSETESDKSEEDMAVVEVDGRLSAIMPRRLFLDDAAVKSGLLQVFVRMKPVPDTTDTCMQLDQNQLLKATWRNKEAVYKFSKVFQQDSDQANIYEGTTAALVDDLLQQRQPSAVVMAYGVTNAGKTFTMQGAPDRPGLVPQALAHIFKSCSSSMRVCLSVMEIYNECIHDLLAPPHMRAKPAALRLKEDKAGHIVVQGLSEVGVSSMREAQELLRRAAKARQSSGTNANEHSSRSHAVITVKVRQVSCSSSHALDTPATAAAAAPATAGGGLLTHLQQQNQQQQQRHCQLCFVDLAGCERVKRTGNSGARLRESVAINSSLMTLARCLEVLRYNQQHPADQKVIPFRESKITHLFKDVLHGNGRFVMVVNVSPAAEEFNETKRVLQYAALASKVTMTSEVEHDILVGPDGAWGPSNTTAAAAGQLPPGSTAATAESLAAAEAAAAAARAALSSAQARIEELLDDKADLEYEVDVVERKVELLREELIKAEVEKEQLEAEIRAEVAADMQALLDGAAAEHKAAAEQAARNLAAASQEAAALQDKVHQLEQQLQAMADRAAADQQQVQGSVSRSEHHKLLQEAVAAAKAEVQVHAQAEHTAEVALLVRHDQQQLNTLQTELLSLHQQLAAAQRDRQQEQVQAQAAAAAAASQMEQLHAVAAEALALLQASVMQQQAQDHGLSDGTVQLQHAAQQLQAFVRIQQQQHDHKPVGQQQSERREQQAKADAVHAAAGAATPDCPAAPVEPNAAQDQQLQAQHFAQEPLPQQQQQQQQLEPLPQLQEQPAHSTRAVRSSRRSTLAPTGAAAAPAAVRRRRQTLAAAGPPSRSTSTEVLTVGAAVGAFPGGADVATAAAAATGRRRQVTSPALESVAEEEEGLGHGAAASTGVVPDGSADAGGTAGGSADAGGSSGALPAAAAAVEAAAAAAAAPDVSAVPPEAATVCPVSELCKHSSRVKGGRKRGAEQLHCEHLDEEQQQQCEVQCVQHDPEQLQPQQQHQCSGGHSKRACREQTAVPASRAAAVDGAAAATGRSPAEVTVAAAAAAGESAAAAGISGSMQACVGGVAAGAQQGGEASLTETTAEVLVAAMSPAKGNKQRRKTLAAAAKQARQLQKQRRPRAAAAGEVSVLPSVQEEEEEEHPAQTCPQKQQKHHRNLKQQQQQDADVEVWQSAELVLCDVTTQKQLGPVVRGRRATIATMGGAAAAADADDGMSVQAAAGGSGGGSASGGGGGSSRTRKRLVPGADGSRGAGKEVGGGGASRKQLLQIAGGLTPVAYRTRHRGR